MAVNIHLLYEERVGEESTKTYSDSHTAFYITFYERLTQENLEGLTARNFGSLIEESRDRKVENWRPLPQIT